MDAKKALILTWVGIGLLVAGAIGFFLGRRTLGNLSGPGQLPSGEQQEQPPQGGPGIKPPASEGPKIQR